MKNCFFKLTIISVSLIFSSGCSVYKASCNDGVSASDIESCKNRACLLSKGMEVINKKDEINGEYTEISKAIARKSDATYARAVGHGVLDVMTLGLWEVAGTPIEGSLSNDREYIVAKATYSKQQIHR